MLPSLVSTIAGARVSLQTSRRQTQPAVKGVCRPATLTQLEMSDLVRAGSLGKGGLLGGLGRQTRVERPRPLKMSGGTQPELRPEDLLALLEAVLRGLTARTYTGQMVGQVASLCANLKRSGATMESSRKEQMDRLLSAMVAACRDDNLDLVTRVHMLEIIELRSMGWQTNENVTNYYKQKLATIEAPAARAQTAPVQLNPTAPDFTPDRPPPGRPLRRSADSPLAPPPALARPRPLVGGAGDSQTELLPPSPARLPSAGHQHSATLLVGPEQLVISGSSADLVRTAKIVLHEFFNVCGGPRAGDTSELDSSLASPPAGARSKNSSGGSSTSSGPAKEQEELEEGELVEEDDGPELELVKPELSYDKCELLQLARSPLCRVAPDRWTELAAELPGVVRRADRAGPTSALILREMEEIRRQEAAPKFH